MTKFFALFSLFSKQMFRGNSLRPDGKKSKLWIAYLILGLYLLMFLSLGAFLMFLVGRQSISSVEPAFNIIEKVILMGQIATLTFGIGTILNTIYSNNDSGIVLPLPVNGSMVFSVRATLVYLQEFFISALAVLFLLVPFGIGYNAGAMYYIVLLPVLILMPVLPLCVGMLLAFPLSLLSSFLKNRGIIGTFVYILLFAVLFGASYLFFFNAGTIMDNENLTNIVEVMYNFLSTPAWAFSPNLLAAKALTLNFEQSALNLGLYVVILLALLVIIFFISRAVYSATLSRDTENGMKHYALKSDYKQNGKLALLIKSDYKNLFRDNKLGFFCLSGVVMSPVVIGVFAYVSTQNMAEMSPYVGSSIFAMFVLLLCSTNAMATTAFSREKGVFFVYKYIPIDRVLYTKSKVYAAMIIQSICTVVCSIVILIFNICTIYYMLMILVAMLVLQYGNCCLQVMFDMKHPRLKWSNLQEGLKNNSAAMWSILLAFSQLIIFELCVVLGNVFEATFAGATYISLAILIVLSIVYALISHLVVFKKCDKYIEAIE